MIKAKCISCGGPINVGSKPKLGQRIKCSTCAAELEVAWLEPLELDWPYDEDDYDMYDEEDEEEIY